MLKENFSRVYDKFKLLLYSRAFRSLGDGKNDDLTSFEVLCMEIIGALREPTINEFAEAAQLSPPNATYRIGQLIKKGYIKKIQSQYDKREYYLVATDKYANLYGVVYDYIDIVISRIEKRFPKDKIEVFTEVLGAVADEMTPEAESFVDVAYNNGNLKISKSGS
ncbi:MAG: MarR family transcriptional regulator [Clostridiales bacterium]|nr:MarR family transcriptional regulator [Clostridiales bacterium]MDY4061101.1 MarR family transcriptional regulator [Anaerovoracaceae bacterium]